MRRPCASVQVICSKDTTTICGSGDDTSSTRLVCEVSSLAGVSFLKDSFGYGAFFVTFEYVKAESYYAFVTRYYGFLNLNTHPHSCRRGPDSDDGALTIRPHFALAPTLLMLAGISASIMQQSVQHPLNLIQNLHYDRLESLDYQAKLQPSRG